MKQCMACYDSETKLSAIYRNIYMQIKIQSMCKPLPCMECLYLPIALAQVNSQSKFAFLMNNIKKNRERKHKKANIESLTLHFF